MPKTRMKAVPPPKQSSAIECLVSLTTSRFNVVCTDTFVKVRHRPTGDVHLYRHDGTEAGIVRALRRADAGEAGDDAETEIRQGTRL